MYNTYIPNIFPYTHILVSYIKDDNPANYFVSLVDLSNISLE